MGKLNIENMSWIDIMDNDLALSMPVQDANGQGSRTMQTF
jgi:hypothetical protein